MARSSNWNRRNNANQNRDNSLNELINEIKKSTSLKQVFTPEKYALEDGWAYKTAKSLLKNNSMNSTQIRKFFTELKEIEKKLKLEKDLNKCKNEILLLMPQVAYALGRKVVPKGFYNLMSECINLDKIKEPDDYFAFVRFFTAVVAYSKIV